MQRDITTLIGTALRTFAALTTAFMLMAALPSSALAHTSSSVDGQTSMAGSGPASDETGAQLPGSPDRPIRDRGAGEKDSTKPGTGPKPPGPPSHANKGTGQGTKGATKNGSKTGTHSMSKNNTTAGTNHQTGTQTNEGKHNGVLGQENGPGTTAGTNHQTGTVTKNASNTGTRSASKAATTAGTNHQTGTMTQGGEEAAPSPEVKGVENAPNTTAGTNHQTGTMTQEANQATTAGTNHQTGTQTQSGEQASPSSPSPAAAGNQSSPTTTPAPTQLGFQQGPMNQAGVQTAPTQGMQLGIENLPSTSTAAIPPAAIALLTMGGTLYAITRKKR